MTGWRGSASSPSWRCPSIRTRSTVPRKAFSSPIGIWRDTTPRPNVQAEPFLWTSPDSWAESDLQTRPVRFDPGKDKRGRG